LESWQEFRTWLVEERKINPETMTKERTKKEFAVYVEDYNTGLFATPCLPVKLMHAYFQRPFPTRRSVSLKYM